MFSKYSRIPRNPEEAAVDENAAWLQLEHMKASSLSNLTVIATIGVTTLLAGIVGFSIGALVFRSTHTVHIADTVPQVPIGFSVQNFQYNGSFAAPPIEQGIAEPFWDSLIPNGLGYVKGDPLSGQNLSVISAFHQLHCLYTLRRAYYSTTSGGEDFDFGLDRKHHAGHCFEYLRQSIMCSADSTIEPAEEAEKGFLGCEFRRQCRDYDELGEWAEKWRAFDGHGFLAHPTHRHDR